MNILKYKKLTNGRYKVILENSVELTLYEDVILKYELLIKREIVNLYEADVLGTLIVTTAFTEGVNTNASNLIFTSLINGPTTNTFYIGDIRLHCVLFQ